MLISNASVVDSNVLYVWYVQFYRSGTHTYIFCCNTAEFIAPHYLSAILNHLKTNWHLVLYQKRFCCLLFNPTLLFLLVLGTIKL